MFCIKSGKRSRWVKVMMLAILVSVCFTGCRTKTGEDLELVMIPRIYLETGGEGAQDRSVAVQLPFSGVKVLIDSLPVFVESDMSGLDLVEVEVGLGYSFELKPDAAKALYLLSLKNRGKRLVLFVNGRAIGARVVDGVMREGVLVIVPELNKEELYGSINLIENGIRKASK